MANEPINVIYNDLNIMIDKTCLIKTMFFDDLFSSSEIVSLDKNDRGMPMVDLKPLTGLSRYTTDELKWFFNALLYDYPITLANTENNIDRASLIDYFLIKEENYLYCWYESERVSYTLFFNYDSFCEDVTDMHVNHVDHYPNQERYMVFSIPERCEKIDLMGANIVGIEGWAKVINVSLCWLTHTIFKIPEQCEKIDLSYTDITGISGWARDINVMRCSGLEGIFKIPEQCETIDLCGTEIDGIEGWAKDMRLSDCRFLSGVFTIPEGCEKIDLAGTDITGIDGWAKHIIVYFCEELLNKFRIPEQCEKINLAYTHISGIEGEAKSIDVSHCDNLSGIFKIPDKCEKINLSCTGINGIEGWAKDMDVSHCKKLRRPVPNPNIILA